MLLIYLLIISDIYALSQNQFNMYNTDQYQNGYCLFYYLDHITIPHFDSTFLLGNRVKRSSHLLIPYCLRMSENTPRFEHFNFPSHFGQSYTFDKLKQMNISSKLLLSWSATIDLAERYEMFLNNIFDPSILSEKETLFYNCTTTFADGVFVWFGPLCRFGLFYSKNNIIHLAKLIHTIMYSNRDANDASEISCYKHLTCQRLTYACLDWREVCDGKVDCLNGEDEFDCWKMEISECASNEYRCRNGQCIPKEFFNDDPSDPDCLDQTDEFPRTDSLTRCEYKTNFGCQEQLCRHRDEFPCGNGECVDGAFVCQNRRDNIWFNDDCLQLMACLTKKKLEYYGISSCELISETYRLYYLADNCPTYFEFPFRSVLFDHVHFIYTRENLLENFTDIPLPEYVCYDAKFCGKIYPIELFYKNFTCRYFKHFQFNENQSFATMDLLIEAMKIHFIKCQPIFNEAHHCNYSTMYQCLNSSKCISKSRLVDGYNDCPLNDDETYNASCSLDNVNFRYRCLVNNVEKCFASAAIQNMHHDCDSREDEMNSITFGDNPNGIHFGYICNGYLDLFPVLIDGKYISDESECESQSCNNTYSQCDGFWSCKNGADEIGCFPSDCPSFHHQCIFPNETSKVSCLPMFRAGDGTIDCIGGTDELYQKITSDISKLKTYDNYFRCLNDTKYIRFAWSCDRIEDCLFSDDENENYCPSPSIGQGSDVCSHYKINQTKPEEFLCRFNGQSQNQSLIVKFLLKSIPFYSIQTINDLEVLPTMTNTQLIEIPQISYHSSTMLYTERKWCYFGIPIDVRIDENITDTYCFCPPNYYGDQCEYQSERVTFTFQISLASNWTTLFLFLVTLIDNERNIQSYDYIDYSSVKDCDRKFNMYLLYSGQRKNFSKNYSVQIELLNRMSFAYRSSWIYPILYPFLPVYRLSVLLRVPVSDSKIDDRCNLSCIHGKCYAYVNYPNSIYCRCDSGWSGIDCNTKLDCYCSSDSLCLSNSICVCPLNRHGPRCYLNYSSCHSNPCQNNGQCLSTDLRWINHDDYDIHLEPFQCICSIEYSGKLCQDRENQNRIEISLSSVPEIPSTLLIHFLTPIDDYPLVQRVSLMRKIPVDRDIILLQVSFDFNMAFAKLFNDYYLIILREQRIISANISTRIDSTYRCLSIDQLLNATVVNEYYLKRIKYYHESCYSKKELICFYDQSQICFCDVNRDANCFQFDFNQKYGCNENNYCQNQGQCFFNRNRCPTSSICVCEDCYFGTQCQFSTKGSTLSLDIILGSHIRQNTSINDQTTIVKWSIFFNLLMVVCGLTNSILTFLTFQMAETRDIGCGIYLFVSSFSSLLITIMMTIKFWFLIYSQIGSITNRSFLSIQCLLFDFLIQTSLSINDWLHSCVSFDRLFNVLKGARFDKMKSKRIARRAIFGIIFLSICTHLHDPIHRSLHDDDEEKRTWCLAEYSFGLRLFDKIVNLSHFLIPFIMNLYSALVVIKVIAQTRLKLNSKNTYKHVLMQQFLKHKHLIISALILFVLAIPRLVISSVSGCMKSPRNPWFYLFGYFISFIPSVLTFIVLVLPSKTYKEQFKKSINRFRRRTNVR